MSRASAAVAPQSLATLTSRQESRTPNACVVQCIESIPHDVIDTTPIDILILQIKHLRQQTDTAMIFLVATYRKELYKQMSNFLQDTDNVAALDSCDSFCLSEVIKKQYESIKKRVIVRSENPNDNIQINVNSSCSDKGNLNVAKEEIAKQFPTEQTEFIILGMHL
jgi:hypothetical protein